MKTIGFFNNKGGVGKTTLVYHLAWMLARLGLRVIAVDLDPQTNLTSMFIPEERLETLFDQAERGSIYDAVSPLFRGVGDIAPPSLEHVADGIALVAGDLRLSNFEDDLSQNWLQSGNRRERSLRVTSAFARTIATAVRQFEASVALVDVGPNLGALNRSALLACDAIIVPLGADLFSLQALRNMGPKLREWRGQWSDQRAQNPDPTLALPAGVMAPSGYILMRHSVQAGKPAQAFNRWIERMPAAYREYVLDDPADAGSTVEPGEHCLAVLKDYRSLMPLAQEARKPMFLLRPGDGAFGGHQQAVHNCYQDFQKLAMTIMSRCAIPTPATHPAPD